MQTLKDKLDWPVSAFCSDGSDSDSAASIGLSSDGRDVCIQPFREAKNVSGLSVKLADLIQLEDYLQFDKSLLTIKNRNLSVFTLGFWVIQLLNVFMFVTGNKDQIKENIFDTSLQSYKNPGKKEDFPYDRPLKIVGLLPYMGALVEGNPHLSVLDESTGKQWSMSLEVFSHVQFISVANGPSDINAILGAV